MISPSRFEAIVDDDRLHEFVIPDHEVVGLAHREAAALRQDLVLADGAHVWTGSTRAKVSLGPLVFAKTWTRKALVGCSNRHNEQRDISPQGPM